MEGIVTSFTAVIFLGAFISIAVLVMTVLMGVWTYRDAVSRGMNGILWTLVVLLVPSFIGLIIYLIVRMDSRKVTCSKCMQKVNANSRFCSKCGQELEPVLVISEEDDRLRKSQKRVLIGFFSALGGIVIAIIFMIAFILTGIVGVVDSGIKAFSGLGRNVAQEFADIGMEDVSDMLESLDELFGREGIHIDVNGQEVTIATDEGEEIIHVEDDGERVHVNTSALYGLMEKYGIRYNRLLSEEEMEEAIDEYVDSYVEKDMGKMEDNIEDAAKKLEDAADRMEAALGKGDLSVLHDLEEEAERAQRIDIIPSGAAVPSKTVQGKEEIDAFVERLDMEDWKAGTLPADAKELGAVSYISEYKGIDGKKNEYKVFKIYVYQDVPCVKLELAGITLALEVEREEMQYLASLFEGNGSLGIRKGAVENGMSGKCHMVCVRRTDKRP